MKAVLMRVPVSYTHLGHEHLAQIFHLLLFLARVVDARELGDALDQIGDGGGEALGDVVVGRVGVLDAVVQKGGDDGFAVKMQFLGHDLRNGDCLLYTSRCV